MAYAWRHLLAVGVAIAAVPCVWAQQASSQPQPGSAQPGAAQAGAPQPPSNPVGSAPAAGSSGNALTQRGWDIKPNIGLDFTQTDNVTLLANGGKSDLITRLSPGVVIQGQGGRARAYIDFKLERINYMNTEGRDRVQRALNGMGTVELADKWLYLDVSSRISRQAVSAFAAPASGSDSLNNNVVETRMYQVAPYIQGRLLGSTDYKLRFDNTWYSMQNHGPMNNTVIQSVQGSLSGATGLSRLNWALDANAQQSEYSNNAKNKTNALRGSLTYAFDPQFRFTVIGGQESNDYVDFKQQTSSITGWGFDWAPGERTLIKWTHENRYFGQGYNFNLTHRTANTAWRISDTRDVMLRAPQSMTYARGTYFDLLNEQLRSTIPDDAERSAYIQTLLLTTGISPDAQVIGGFTTSRASVNHNREISFTWTGVRNVIAVSAMDLDRRALGTGIGVPDDFDISQRIRQRGVNANWSHKLTSTAALALMANKSYTSGNNSALDSDRLMYSATLSNKLGAYTSGSIGYRRTQVNGAIDYVENAVLASLLMVF
ncbi:MAG: TIGR03016 family PEP-CTERM system-associated outer membrane protein [Rhodocyclaceae bacterium]|nr:TIGR03016 family PEP-CTERM system-associated outer membrane protein [Rhodocyclaceae bacterium]